MDFSCFTRALLSYSASLTSLEDLFCTESPIHILTAFRYPSLSSSTIVFPVHCSFCFSVFHSLFLLSSLFLVVMYFRLHNAPVRTNILPPIPPFLVRSDRRGMVGFQLPPQPLMLFIASPACMHTLLINPRVSF